MDSIKREVEEFIKQHHHINYCEAIITKDGLVQYAVPSHVEALIKITEKTRDYIYNEMPIDDSPIIWLVEYTGCIVIWSGGYIAPKEINAKQLLVLAELVSNKLVSNRNIYD